MRTVKQCESLKKRTFLGKKMFFNFLGANFLVPKSGHRCERQSVFGLDIQSISTTVAEEYITVLNTKETRIYLFGVFPPKD